MTTKDHKILAEALRDARETAIAEAPGSRERGRVRRIGVDIATNAVADALKANNPRFDEGLFYAVVRGEA